MVFIRSTYCFGSSSGVFLRFLPQPVKACPLSKRRAVFIPGFLFIINYPFLRPCCPVFLYPDRPKGPNPVKIPIKLFANFHNPMSFTNRFLFGFGDAVLASNSVFRRIRLMRTRFLDAFFAGEPNGGHLFPVSSASLFILFLSGRSFWPRSLTSAQPLSPVR